ncbi:MAG: hypothetical protein C4320_02215, partial [Armatimonadota bacterium]
PPEYLSQAKNHRTRSSLLIQGPEGNLLVDCAPEMRLQLTGNRIYDVDHVLITHTHADHLMGMDDLRSLVRRRAAAGKGDAIPVTTIPRYQEDIRRVFSYAFAPVTPGLLVPRVELRDLQPKERIVGLTVRSALVEHGKVPVVAIRIGGFGYVTDCSVITPEARDLLTGLDVLILDATRFTPHPSHLHLEKSLAEIEKLAPRKAYLTHLSHDYDASAPPELPDRVALAYDGLLLRFEKGGDVAKRGIFDETSRATLQMGENLAIISRVGMRPNQEQ